jgi:cytoskeletal protein CcmA (bactofilin family)
MNEPNFLVRLAIGVGLAKRSAPDVRMQSLNDTHRNVPTTQDQQRRVASAQTPPPPRAAAQPQPGATPQRQAQASQAEQVAQAQSQKLVTSGGATPEPGVSRSAEPDIGTVIPVSAKLTGDLHIEESIVLECVVRGNVTQDGDHQVVLTATGGIHGTLRAKTAVIGGTVEGDVFADRILVLETGVIHGDVEYTTIAMKEGATVDGTLRRVVPNVVGASEGASASMLRSVPLEGERVA